MQTKKWVYLWDIWCSTKAVNVYIYITDVRNVTWSSKPRYHEKADIETNSNKRKTCISFRTRRRLVHDPYMSITCSWKEWEIFKKYSINLKIFQIISLVCLVKKYSQNAMSTVFNLNLIFWVSNQISFIWNTKYYWSNIY